MCISISLYQYGYMKGEGLGNTADRLKKLDKSKDEDQVIFHKIVQIYGFLIVTGASLAVEGHSARHLGGSGNPGTVLKHHLLH